MEADESCCVSGSRRSRPLLVRGSALSLCEVMADPDCTARSPHHVGSHGTRQVQPAHGRCCCCHLVGRRARRLGRDRLVSAAEFGTRARADGSIFAVLSTDSFTRPSESCLRLLAWCKHAAAVPRSAQRTELTPAVPHSAIQKLLQGLRMDPLVSLYCKDSHLRCTAHMKLTLSTLRTDYAPVCAGLNALLIPVYEGWAPFEQIIPTVGLPFLIINASTALLLNIAVVFLIGSASSLVLTLSGAFSPAPVALYCTLLTLFACRCREGHPSRRRIRCDHGIQRLVHPDGWLQHRPRRSWYVFPLLHSLLPFRS